MALKYFGIWQVFHLLKQFSSSVKNIVKNVSEFLIKNNNFVTIFDPFQLKNSICINGNAIFMLFAI